MLFNSFEFVLVFLPIVVIGFYLLGRHAPANVAISWLVTASLFFYAWWNPPYVLLIVSSVLFNYAVGHALIRKPSKAMLTFGIALNLLLLGYFKYTNFLIDNVNAVFGAHLHIWRIVLPLAISFHTFQQISYLVECRRGTVRSSSLLHYFLFVTFFPQLIAGPIVRHDEMLPQFSRGDWFRPDGAMLAMGLTVFFIGLCKKVLIADQFAPFVGPVFDMARDGGAPSFLEAWSATLAYTFQLYFDFSAYSDMAIGLGFLFGITLPLNFNSPYKATGMIDFWRRWHMTLSRFLRDYLYIPLGGSQKGPTRTFVNLFIVMFLGGLWHGAAWTFVLWGLLHGAYLTINHLWRAHRGPASAHGAMRALSITFTFLCAALAWVLFRADTIGAAGEMYRALGGLNGVTLGFNHRAVLGPFADLLARAGVTFVPSLEFSGLSVLWIAAGFAIAMGMPNTFEWVVERRRTGFTNLIPALNWKPTRAWAFAMGLVAIFAIQSLSNPSAFLYFNF